MNRYDKLLKRIQNGETILIDGGTGTEVERRGVPQTKNAWNAGGSLTHPDIVRQIHEDFINKGSEIVISNTFATSKHLMKDAECLDDFEKINCRSVELAVEARNNSKNPNALVAGGISHWSFTNILPSLDELKEGAMEQASIMKNAGADLIMLEMMIDIPRMLAVYEGAKTSNLPIWVGLSCEPDKERVMRLLGGQKDLYDSTPNSRIGQTLEEAIMALNDTNVPLLSIMHTDVAYIDQCLEIVGQHWNRFVGIYAHSGDDINMKWTFDDVISPQDYTNFCKKWINYNLSIIGGCCGTGPEHICDLKKNLFN